MQSIWLVVLARRILSWIAAEMKVFFSGAVNDAAAVWLEKLYLDGITFAVLSPCLTWAQHQRVAAEIRRLRIEKTFWSCTGRCMSILVVLVVLVVFRVPQASRRTSPKFEVHFARLSLPLPHPPHCLPSIGLVRRTHLAESRIAWSRVDHFLCAVFVPRAA